MNCRLVHLYCIKVNWGILQLLHWSGLAQCFFFKKKACRVSFILYLSLPRDLLLSVLYLNWEALHYVIYSSSYCEHSEAYLIVWYNLPYWQFIFLTRWSELTRKIQLWVEIQELNEQGEYSAVEVTTKPDILTGGIYQLRQGQQRRIQVRVKPVQNSGTLPIICQSIVSIAVGSVSMR